MKPISAEIDKSKRWDKRVAVVERVETRLFYGSKKPLIHRRDFTEYLPDEGSFFHLRTHTASIARVVADGASSATVRTLRKADRSSITPDVFFRTAQARTDAIPTAAVYDGTLVAWQFLPLASYS